MGFPKIQIGRPKHEIPPSGIDHLIDKVHNAQKMIKKRPGKFGHRENPNLEDIKCYLKRHSGYNSVSAEDFEPAIGGGFIGLDSEGSYSLTQKAMISKCFGNAGGSDFESLDASQREYIGQRTSRRERRTRVAIGTALYKK